MTQKAFVFRLLTLNKMFPLFCKCPNNFSCKTFVKNIFVLGAFQKSFFIKKKLQQKVLGGGEGKKIFLMSKRYGESPKDKKVKLEII